jgi:hypothetical protein
MTLFLLAAQGVRHQAPPHLQRSLCFGPMKQLRRSLVLLGGLPLPVWG